MIKPGNTYRALDITNLAALFSSHASAVFLDTARSTNHTVYSYLFLNPVKIYSTNRFEDIKDILRHIDEACREYWVSGYMSYEAGYAFEDSFKRYRINSSTGLPLLWFGVFEKPFMYSHSTGTWDRALPLTDGTSEYRGCSISEHSRTKIRVRPTLSYSEYKMCIENIRRNIELGNTYQVNFTHDFLIETCLSDFDVYQTIRSNQRTSLCSYIQTEFGTIASFSPELFFEIQGSTIQCKPMKGTIGRGIDIEKDKDLKSFLLHDPKNRAENLMIVDLLRNDLGRICRAGSIRVENLFSIETHPTVHQMTSCIHATLKKNSTFSAIVRALFPCGSITGAPKIRTMHIIRALEKGHRGVYCGMIGFVSPEEKSVFSVPIRTIQKSQTQEFWNFRVGGGIVWDSKPTEEWDECMQKSKFLTFSMPEFLIIESFCFNGERFLFKSDHILRMKHTALYFNYPFHTDKIESLLVHLSRELEGPGFFKVRLSLDAQGAFLHEYFPLSSGIEKNFKNSSSDTPVPILLMPIHAKENSSFLCHKTSYRPWYAHAENLIAKKECYDVVFYNEQNEITEGSRNNIFVKHANVFKTPPQSAGILPGILRKKLLQKQWCIEESLSVNQLLTASVIYCGNSVRGLQAVFIKDK